VPDDANLVGCHLDIGESPLAGQADVHRLAGVQVPVLLTWVSLLAGQPKLIRASLLSAVPGTAIRRQLAVDISSSCTACPLSSASLLKLTSTAR
jgi:hypothetical protein